MPLLYGGTPIEPGIADVVIVSTWYSFSSAHEEERLWTVIIAGQVQSLMSRTPGVTGFSRYNFLRLDIRDNQEVAGASVVCAEYHAASLIVYLTIALACG